MNYFDHAFILYKTPLITDLECLERGRIAGRPCAQEITDLLALYGTSFDELPHYLQSAVDRIDLEDRSQPMGTSSRYITHMPSINLSNHDETDCLAR